MEGVLLEGGLSLLFAKAGTFKSFVALDIFLHIAVGREWQGRKVRQGRVLYVLGEGAGGFGKRVRAWCMHNQVAEQTLNNSGFVLEPVQFFKEGQADTLNSSMKSWAGLSGVSLVVVDTLATCFVGGEENSNSDMSQFVAALRDLQRATGAAVLLVHHTGKDDERGARGASSLNAALDTEMKIEKKGQRIELKCTKQKDHEAFETVHLAVVQVSTGDGIYSLAVVPGQAKAAKGALRPTQQVALEVLQACGEAGASWKVWQQSWLQRGQVADGYADGYSETSFTRVRERLEEFGFVFKDPAGRYHVTSATNERPEHTHEGDPVITATTTTTPLEKGVDWRLPAPDQLSAGDAPVGRRNVC